MSGFRPVAYVVATAVATSIGVSAAGAEKPSFAGPVAIQGARLVTVSGDVLDRGTIVLADGLIAAVGRNVEIPQGAWTIDGEGRTVYPGLIDGLAAMELRKQGEDEDSERYSQGPDDRPGTTPWIKAADHLADSREDVEKWRQAGFSAAGVAPRGRLVSGQVSVLNLAGERPGERVLRDQVALYVDPSARREAPGFPGSLMGAHAYVRQLFLDARHFARVHSLYQADPRGRQRPAYDRSLATLSGLIGAAVPILMPATTDVEIRRALDLANDVDVPPILYGAHGASGAIPSLTAAGATVLVSLDWPGPPEDPDPEKQEPLRVLRLWDRAKSSPQALQGSGVVFGFASAGLEDPAQALQKTSAAVAAGLSPAAAVRALTLSAAEILGVSDRLGSLEPGKIANLLVTEGELFAGGRPELVVIDGRVFEIEGAVAAPVGTEAEESGAAEPPGGLTRVAESDEDRVARPILIRNGDILTITRGVLEDGEILVRDGRIAAVGRGLEVPAGARMIDAGGGYVMPGMVDCHSHIAIDGGVNESTIAVSSMARIEDVLDPTDVSIYRAVAGGVTTANILHGSANPIGGLNAVIKLRWGEDARGLLFEGAPPGIKLALGENPKRSNVRRASDRPPRYPATRMGVMNVIRDAFVEAGAYREEWRSYRERQAAGEEPLPPRRDLRLDPLIEVLDGERLVHAHSYRADEIVQLLRLAEELGFRIATLQHVLEGYRVPDEIAAHGAGASTFSDHWAYKIEAYEAIPFNAALMTERGVVVSINSDSAEEIRHLNQEAAKAVRWGGLSETEALKLVTLNPAIQLGIAERVGSLEAGKDADLVITDRHPLSIYAVVQKTLIDGKVVFDREEERLRRTRLQEEREELERRVYPAPEAEPETGPTAGR